MGCIKIKDGFICDFTEYRNYVCFEHTTYLFEFSQFGPAWFTVPDDKYVGVVPDGHLSCLWDMFEAWQAGREEG